MTLCKADRRRRLASPLVPESTTKVRSFSRRAVILWMIQRMLHHAALQPAEPCFPQVTQSKQDYNEHDGTAGQQSQNAEEHQHLVHE